MKTKYIKIHWGDLPTWIAPALINNDLAGLTQPEIEAIPELEQIFTEEAKEEALKRLRKPYTCNICKTILKPN